MTNFNARISHNPGVGGSNPSPATILFCLYPNLNLNNHKELLIEI